MGTVLKMKGDFHRWARYWLWLRLRCLVLGHSDSYVDMSDHPYATSYWRCGRCARRVYRKKCAC